MSEDDDRGYSFGGNFRQVPLVTYQDGEKKFLCTIELRDTVDGVVGEINFEMLNANPVSSTALFKHLISPSLRANPYDPAIYGVGLSNEGLRMVDEIDRNARAYGYEIGKGHSLAKHIPATSLTNPFLDADWKKRLTDGT